MDIGKKRWTYEAGLDWVLARKRYLTATDIVSLLPELKRIKKSGLKESEYGKYSPACAGIWAEKTADTEPDLFAPSNDAARGHVLEPYALQEFNRLTKDSIYPWDDMLVVDEERKFGFSPDGLNVKQPIEYGGVIPASSLKDECLVTKMVEVKCYAPKRHTEALLEDRFEHKERYQIAVAMDVLQSIGIGAVIWFNPSARKQIIVETYKRDDLANEISDVEEIINMYNATAETLEKMFAFSSELTEDGIYQKFIEERDGGNNLGTGLNQ